MDRLIIVFNLARTTKMNLPEPDSGPVTVWCPIIPEEDLKRLSSQSKGLHEINDAFYEWQAVMRGKSIVGASIGILLDRIRMLMINVGIAVGLNRSLAEEVQDIISTKLRTGSLGLVTKMESESPEDKLVKKTLAMFFAKVKFTRDIDPLEDIRAAMPDLRGYVSDLDAVDIFRMFGVTKATDLDESRFSDIRIKVTKLAMAGSTNVIKRIFLRLLNPDPWGNG
ncbi:MAG: hypothetical protein ACFFEU_05745 [Candidatus Thorarchaeota archaeon]